MIKTPAQRRDIADLIQKLQYAIGGLRDRFTMDEQPFYALRMVEEAVHVAWYVIAEGYDGNRLEILESEIRTLKRELGYLQEAEE